MNGGCRVTSERVILQMGSQPHSIWHRHPASAFCHERWRLNVLASRSAHGHLLTRQWRLKLSEALFLINDHSVQGAVTLLCLSAEVPHQCSQGCFFLSLRNITDTFLLSWQQQTFSLYFKRFSPSKSCWTNSLMVLVFLHWLIRKGFLVLQLQSFTSPLYSQRPLR